MPFSHAPVGGQGNIVVQQIQSPNYDKAAGTGWRIGKDGSAYFADVQLPNVKPGTTVTFSGTKPASPSTGDVWYDTANGLAASQWNGAAWVPYQIGTGAIADGGVQPSNIAALTASLIGNVGPLNANPYFTGGDTSGWTAQGGTLTATDTPPAGCPTPYAARYANTAGGSGNMSQYYSPFLVTPGEQVQVSAWVWTPTGTADFGADWLLDGTYVSYTDMQATVPASTWTHAGAVLTVPAGVNQCGIFLDGYDSTAYTMYATVITASPQVPGTLIEAASVTDAQMAAGAAVANLSAGDITADLLAAGAALANVGTGGITAGYLAAGAVVAAAIAAGAVTADAIAAGTVVAGIVDGTEIDSATFKGTNWVENSAGMFLYSGTPAAGNLLMSVAPAAGTDAHGNAYQAGACVYGTSPSFTALQEVGGQAVLVVQPAGTWTPGNAVSPVIFSTSGGAGNGEHQFLTVDSGAPPAQASRRSRIVLSSGSPDGTSSVPHIGFYGGNSDLLLADLSTSGLEAAVNGVLQGWQPMTLQNGWAVGSGGVARYKLMPDNTVMIQLNNVTPGVISDGTIMWVFPGGYQPVTEQKLPLLVQYTSGTFGSSPFLYTNTSSGGALVCYNLRGTVASVQASARYALD